MAAFRHADQPFVAPDLSHLTEAELTAHATYATGTKHHREAARTQARLAEIRGPRDGGPRDRGLHDERRMVNLLEAVTEFVLEQCAHGGGAVDVHADVRRETQTLGNSLIAMAVATGQSMLIRTTTIFVEIACAP